MGWWSGEDARFRSQLSPDECVGRLQTRVVSMWKPFGGGEFAGTIKPSRIAVTPRHVGRRNSWQTWFVGSIEPDGSGAIIVGHFRIARFTMVFMTFWFGGVGLFTITTVSLAMSREAPPWMPIFPILMLAFGIGLVRFGRWMARNDRAEIETLFRDELLAVLQ